MSERVFSAAGAGLGGADARDERRTRRRRRLFGAGPFEKTTDRPRQATAEARPLRAGPMELRIRTRIGEDRRGAQRPSGRVAQRPSGRLGGVNHVRDPAGGCVAPRPVLPRTQQGSVLRRVRWEPRAGRRHRLRQHDAASMEKEGPPREDANRRPCTRNWAIRVRHVVQKRALRTGSWDSCVRSVGAEGALPRPSRLYAAARPGPRNVNLRGRHRAGPGVRFLPFAAPEPRRFTNRAGGLCRNLKSGSGFFPHFFLI